MLFSRSTLQRLFGFSAELDFKVPPNKPMQQTARVFEKEGRCIVKLGNVVKRSATTSWQVITPQLMGRAVRQQHIW